MALTLDAEPDVTGDQTTGSIHLGHQEIAGTGGHGPPGGGAGRQDRLTTLSQFIRRGLRITADGPSLGRDVVRLESAEPYGSDQMPPRRQQHRGFPDGQQVGIGVARCRRLITGPVIQVGPEPIQVNTGQRHNRAEDG